MKYDGCRVNCGQCKCFKNGTCSLLENDQIKISEKNNVCRKFKHRIINPSSPVFNFDNYLEWLGTDYYRPYTIDKKNIIGSAKLGEVIIDGGHLAELLPSVYSPFYETVDKPWCRKHMPRCHVEYEGHKFEIDYVRYREKTWIDEDSIKFDQHLWKERKTQRKYQKEYYGKFKIQNNKELILMSKEKTYLPEDAYTKEDIETVKELVEVYGMPEGAAVDCLASRTAKEMETVLTFLRRYGSMIKVS